MTTTNLPAIDPKRTAVLVMDVQNGVVGSAPEPDALLERVKGVIADVRAAGGTIGYVWVAFTQDDWAAVPETNTAFSQLAKAKGLHHEDAAAQIDERIAPEDGEMQSSLRHSTRCWRRPGSRSSRRRSKRPARTRPRNAGPPAPAASAWAGC